MKIYIYRTIQIEKTNRGVTNHHVVQEGVLESDVDVFVHQVLPAAHEDTSDRCLRDMRAFIEEHYPEYTFSYQEQDIDYRLSTEKAIKGLHPNYDDDIRSVGTGKLLAPATYAVLAIGAGVKDMQGRAEAIVNVAAYFGITPKDLEICKERYHGGEHELTKFSWEK